MSLKYKLEQIIENDDYILLSKLIENGVDLNVKIIYDDNKNKHNINCNKCKHMRECERNFMCNCKCNPYLQCDCDENECTCRVIKIIFCDKCIKGKLICNIRCYIFLFVELLFHLNLKKSINVLINSDFNFTDYHPISTPYTITPLHYLFLNNDIENFEKMAKKDIYLNTIYNTWKNTSFIYDIVTYCKYNKKSNYSQSVCGYTNECDLNNAKYLKILFDNGLKKDLFPINLLNYSNSILEKIISCKYFNCAQLLLNNGMDINRNILAPNLCYIRIINRIRPLNNKIIIFSILNGLDIKNVTYNKETIKYIKIALEKIKTTFMICILHKTAKHLISDFFKTNPGLYKYIGGKVLNYII